MSDCLQNCLCLPLLLTNTRVDSDAWEVALAQEAIELGGADGALHKNNDLVVVQLIEDVVETTILLSLAELDVVLLKTMKRELGLVIDEDFEGLDVAISTALTRRQRTKNARFA